MNERERLIELLLQTEAFTPDCEEQARKQSEYKADYLLANDIIVPPCKVGDVVYRVVEMSTGITKVIKRTLCPPYRCDVMMNCKPTIKRFIRSVTVTKNNFFDVCENFGKTVFLTKEEAEKALKERESK